MCPCTGDVPVREYEAVVDVVRRAVRNDPGLVLEPLRDRMQALATLERFEEAGDIRDLVGTLDREKAAMGLFITLESPSKDMETEAATTGIYHSTHWGDFPKLQIRTIEQLLRLVLPLFQNFFQGIL